jgi:hypothetical protein
MVTLSYMGVQMLLAAETLDFLLRNVDRVRLAPWIWPGALPGALHFSSCADLCVRSRALEGGDRMREVENSP